MSQPRTEPRTGPATTRAQRRERAVAARQQADQARQRAARRRQLVRWGVGVVVTALVLGGLYLVYDTGTGTGSGGEPASGYRYEVGEPGPGQPAPDFTLPAAGGETVTLSELRGQNVLLYFHEGTMCQPCFDQIRDLEAEADKLIDAGIDELVTITVDPPDRLAQKMRDDGLSSIALSDSDLAVSTQYSAEQYGMMGGSTPGHSFLLVDPDGTIAWRADYGGAPDYTMYLPVDAILADLRADTSAGEV
ncbi:MAG: peroxiredoxin family protein [Natronosporangium sp.]